MKKWFKAAMIRTIKTMAEAALSCLTFGQLVTEVNWRSVLYVSVGAGIYALLTCIKGLPEVDRAEVIRISAERTDTDRRDDSEVEHAED